MANRSSRDVVWAAMQDGVASTDAEIEAVTGLSHSKASPARVALWEDGLVEGLGKNDEGLLQWQLCPPERRDAAKLAYRDHKEKLLLARMMGQPPGARASIVLELLAINDVNEAVIAQLGRRKHHRRIMARVNEARADRVKASRARKRQIAAMHEEADAGLTFAVVMDRLRDSIDALLHMREQIADEADRHGRGEAGRIQYARWPEARTNVREVLETARVVFGEISVIMEEPMMSCPLCGDRLGSATLELDEGYVDATVVEEEETGDSEFLQA
jgi:hypothetical protein